MNTTTTYEGGEQYIMTNEEELVKMCLSSFLENTTYESGIEQFRKLKALSDVCDSEFAIKLAVWARDNGLRTVNQVLLMNSLKSNWFEKGFNALVKRPDEIIDMLGYYTLINGQNAKNLKLANKLKRAMKTRLERFNDYQLAKYKSRGDAINLFDVVNMVHAYSPSIDKMMKGTLESADTWESELSENGNNKTSWDRLLNDKKLGVIAFIRNMRNMLNAGVSQKDMSNYLGDINTDGIFPYQTIQALDVIANECSITSGVLFDAVEGMIKKSFIPLCEMFKGKTAIGIDVSGSMFSPTITPKSKITYIQIAIYYGMYIAEITGADVYLWANECVQIKTNLSFQEIFALARKYQGGTYINKFASLATGYDTTFVITDGQIGEINGYRATGKKNIVWQLGQYKGAITPYYDKKYILINGFNDKLLELADSLQDIGEIVKKIKSIDLSAL